MFSLSDTFCVFTNWSTFCLKEKKLAIIVEAMVNSLSKAKLAMTLTFSNNDWKKDS